MSESFTLAVAPHGAFGALSTLSITGQPPRRFTLQEASILSRALAAVAKGTTAERRIYMSPIASDHDFELRVDEEGVALTCSGYSEIRLSWQETQVLAQELAAASATA